MSESEYVDWIRFNAKEPINGDRLQTAILMSMVSSFMGAKDVSYEDYLFVANTKNKASETKLDNKELDMALQPMFG